MLFSKQLLRATWQSIHVGKMRPDSYILNLQALTMPGYMAAQVPYDLHTYRSKTISIFNSYKNIAEPGQQLPIERWHCDVNERNNLMREG